uniref:V-type proton ATPase subunit a n=1 Tax=Meloidogyne javanica TaxID=6303 RepID=A0A915M4E4_MELJA
MIVERDAAFACVAELGKKPYVQFKDLNADVNSFQRMFAKDIRRFDEMERKLSGILNNFKLIKAHIIVIGFLEAQIRKDNNTILGSVESRDPVEVMPHHEINQLEQTLVDLERDVIHMNNSDQQLKRNYLELKEWQHVLEKADQFFEGGISDAAVHEIEQQSAAAESEAGIALHTAEKEPTGYVVGVILTEKVNAFERILWRGEPIKESVFIIFYNGERLRSIIDKVRVHKSIYSTLNNFTFDGIGKFFVAECWVPLDDVQAVREALETGVGIVDSYGVASYLELNPAPYTIITFPFIFSCMFGDLGHGVLMFLCGLYLVVRERNLEARQIKDEIFNMFFGGRYIILLMGLFSMHAGLVYNDAFAKSFSIFGSAWKNPYPSEQIGKWLNHSEHGKEMLVELPSEFAFMKQSGPYARHPWDCANDIWCMSFVSKLQSFLEAILVIIAVLCIPIMLFGKPIHILMHQRRAKRAVSDNMSVRINMQKDETELVKNGRKPSKTANGDHSGENEPSHGGIASHHDEANIMVHQAIHTIEYVLGCVSHTASYLRLWALSLAHAQLSEVLWDMVLENAFAFNDIKGYIALYAIFFAFGVLTFSILVLMEGLSAFLHALRLHWVEFQSKFYLGQGYIFAPFFFKDILQRASASEMA